MSLSPGELAQGNYCLYEVSKDLTGQLTLAHADQPVCSSPSCNPLVHEQFLLLDVAFNRDCDSQLLGTALDGVLLVRYFVTVFTGPREISGESMRASSTGPRPPADGSPGLWRESATRASCAPNPSASASASAVTWRAS
jgi:hypothetical protein